MSPLKSNSKKHFPPPVCGAGGPRVEVEKGSSLHVNGHCSEKETILFIGSNQKRTPGRCQQYVANAESSDAGRIPRRNLGHCGSKGRGGTQPASDTPLGLRLADFLEAPGSARRTSSNPLSWTPTSAACPSQLALLPVPQLTFPSM